MLFRPSPPQAQVLQNLAAGVQPRRDQWHAVRALTCRGLIERDGTTYSLTEAGRRAYERHERCTQPPPNMARLCR